MTAHKGKSGSASEFAFLTEKKGMVGKGTD